MKYSIVVALLAYISNAADVKLFVADLPPGWPTVFAATIPQSLRIPNTARFTWKFPSLKNQACVTGGRANANPCVGRAMSYVFDATGEFPIELTIEDRSLPNPIVVKETVIIESLDKFPISQRAEIRSIPIGRWRQVVEALYQLKDNGVYDDMAAMHKATFSEGRAPSPSQRSSAHAGPSFLPWHRASMRVMERVIQVALGDDTFGLPYWDWMKGWDGMAAYMGGDGDRNEILDNGPFCNHPNINNSTQCPRRWVTPEVGGINGLKRRLGNDRGAHFQTQRELQILMSMPFYDLPPFDNTPTPDSFRNALEGWLSQSNTSAGFAHNGIHRWVGGTLEDVANSFNDPLFLIHHSQVDRLFTQWQKLKGCDKGLGSAVCYRPGDTDPSITANTRGARQITRNGASVFVLQGHMFGDLMFPWNQRVVDLLVADQGYVYLETNAAPPPPGGPRPKGKKEKPDGKSNDSRRANSAALRTSSSVLLPLLYLYLTLL